MQCIAEYKPSGLLLMFFLPLQKKKNCNSYKIEILNSLKLYNGLKINLICTQFRYFTAFMYILLEEIFSVYGFSCPLQQNDTDNEKHKTNLLRHRGELVFGENEFSESDAMKMKGVYIYIYMIFTS